jgi:alkylation response protein AidB-like acyl-CoA dehydrogenase
MGRSGRSLADALGAPLAPGSEEEVVAAADAFARELAAGALGESQLRHQGMPSDGDSRRVYGELGRGGWIGIHWPRRFGGRGLTHAHTVGCEERFGYHWLPLSGYLLSVKTVGNALLQFASEELKERLLPAISAGELLFCQGFSEPEAGSDLASLRTTAALHDDRFIVNGRKIWTSSVEYADWVYLAVRTGTDQDRHHGLSVLVTEMNTPGISFKVHETLGGGTLGELELDDVEIPAGRIVGELHRGWGVLMGTLDYERVTSEKVGVVLSLLDSLEPLARTAAQRREMLRLRGEAQAARLHGRAAAAALEAGRPASAQSSMAKLSIALLMQRLAAVGTELLGPGSLLEEGVSTLAGKVAAFSRASVATTISGGAAEIQRTVIARRELGC